MKVGLTKNKINDQVRWIYQKCMAVIFRRNFFRFLHKRRNYFHCNFELTYFFLSKARRLQSELYKTANIAEQKNGKKWKQEIINLSSVRWQFFQWSIQIFCKTMPGIFFILSQGMSNNKFCSFFVANNLFVLLNEDVLLKLLLIAKIK